MKIQWTHALVISVLIPPSGPQGGRVELIADVY